MDDGVFMNNVSIKELQERICGEGCYNSRVIGVACATEATHAFFSAEPLNGNISNFTEMKKQPTVSNHTILPSRAI
jgi:hypothetical protein